MVEPINEAGVDRRGAALARGIGPQTAMGLVYEQIEVTLRVPDGAVKDVPEHAAGVGLTTLGEQAVLAE